MKAGLFHLYVTVFGVFRWARLFLCPHQVLDNHLPDDFDIIAADEERLVGIGILPMLFFEHLVEAVRGADEIRVRPFMSTVLVREVDE